MVAGEYAGIKRRYTQEGQDPAQLFRWERRNDEILDTNKKVVWSIKDAEFPVDWSPRASRIVANKYFFRGDGRDYTEKSARDLFKRVNGEISRQALAQGLVSSPQEAAAFGDELFYIVANQMASFNSPVWFNEGLNSRYGVREKKSGASSHWALMPDGSFSNQIDAYERPQTSACFIQSIEDTMEAILDHAKKEGMLFKFGSGTGTNFSALRGINEPLSGGGYASGSISFMRVYDAVAGRVQSGGKTRRAAKMVIQDVDHPDIYRFIHWKVNEERKALWLAANPLWAPRWPGDLESEAYKTVDGQNGNNSVRVSDEFMRAALAGKDWDLWYRTKDKFPVEEEIPLANYKDDKSLPDKRFIKRLTNKRKTVNAGELLENIARAAACVGDPAIQYHDNINKWNTCPNSGQIKASNPCSEFMFVDDSACNLASLNVLKFSSLDELIDTESFRHAVTTMIRAQESLVDAGSYPSPKIAENSHRFRPLGLGYTNLAALLMEKGVAYDSEEGRAIASAVTSLMTAYAYRESVELAKTKGAFEEYAKNKEPMMNVITMHREATKKIARLQNVKGLEKLIDLSDKIWEENETEGAKYGFRNAQVTLLAPTGTIGFMMDVDTTGIEPMPALKSIKGLAGGGQIEMSQDSCVRRGLMALGYKNQKLEDIMSHIKEVGSVVGAPGLSEEHYNVFATAFGNDNTIAVDGHLNMMAAVQPFLSGAISKTVNLPKGSTIQDVRDTYVKGWKLGLKSISLYVDGSKGIQPINVKEKEGKKALNWGDRVKPKNSIVPGEFTEGPTWSLDIGGTGVFISVQEYDDRPPKDAPSAFFISFGSSGSPYAASYTTWGKEASRNRQRGASIEEFVKHNRGASGAVAGMTNHPFIKTVSSIEDAVAKLLVLHYLGDTSVCDVKPTEEQMGELRGSILARRRRDRHFQSRMDYITSIMEKGVVKSVFPLYEDEIKEGHVPMAENFCTQCGKRTVPSGANCRKCPNCGDAGECG